MEIFGQVVFNVFRLGSTLLLLYGAFHIFRSVPRERWVEAISEKKQDGDKISGIRTIGLVFAFIVSALGLYQGMFAGGEFTAASLVSNLLIFVGVAYGVNSARSYGKERLAVKNGKQEQ